MKEIVLLTSDELSGYKEAFFTGLKQLFVKDDYHVNHLTTTSAAITFIKNSTRVFAFIFDWDEFKPNFIEHIIDVNPLLPIIALSESHEPLDINFAELNVNVAFEGYRFESIEDNYQRMQKKIDGYVEQELPPFTKALFDFAAGDYYTFCTPGHLGGTAFQKTPVGTMFYDFYGPNTFKSDLSVSVPQLGSLLDHSGPHRDAEKLAAKVFGSDKTFFVTNGTSTSNKIVGMYAASAGDTVLVDRNCHKSIAHLLMMIDVTPVYLKPTRNALGIIGGIPRSEFLETTIKEKLSQQNLKKWPSYAVITNSTYDGLFYNVEALKKLFKVKNLHFDSAWVPYVNCHPIYAGKYGMYGVPPAGTTIYETSSSHKLLAAFSQASMIHIKGPYDYEIFNECFMMHSSTSPEYSIVASCEISAAMMKPPSGERLMQSAIDEAINFREEIVRLGNEADGWFYNAWQPEHIGTIACWPLNSKDRWHGFKEIDNDHLYLDPIKVTLTLPGIDNGELSEIGIPAEVVAKFLDNHGIVVEKTGPYTMLFLFSMGIDRAKSMTLLKQLMDFKRLYDEDATIKQAIPDLYATEPRFYKNMTLVELCQQIHELHCRYKLPQLMFEAYETLPEMVLTPHQAYEHLIKDQSQLLPLKELQDKVSALMILPYPPGVPLIMPGEKVTQASRAGLDFLLMLEEIGKLFPGFESDIHGLVPDKNGDLLARVLQV